MSDYNYVDMHGEEIRPGYTVKICDDEPEMVYSCSNDFGEDLGINASNEAYLKAHPDAEREYYSLNNFCSSIIEIVSKGT